MGDALCAEAVEGAWRDRLHFVDEEVWFSAGELV
jgi:hypothetical protein